MSKAFELLQQVERERVYTGSAAAVAVAPSNGSGVRHNVVNREEIARLVQRLFRTPDTVVPRVVVFSSVEAGGGCTSIAAAVAENLAAVAPGNFCIVDANLRNPALHRYFDLDNSIGFSDALMENGPVQSFCQRIAGTNLWVLPSGSRNVDSNTLLATDAMPARLAELRADFNHVIIDASPLNRSTDAVLLGRASDGLLLVLESNATRRETARNLTESLKSSNVRVLGAVLNRRTFPIPQNLYERL